MRTGPRKDAAPTRVVYSTMWQVPRLRAEQLPDAPKRLLVLHVPKTGGSSLRAMLQAHVSADRVFLSTGQHDWTWNSMKDLRSKTLFVGHNFLEPLYMFPDEKWVTALALREPLEWWRSYYKYRRRPDRAGSNNPNPSLRLSFDEYIESLPDNRLANPQSAWLLMRTRLGPVASSSSGRIVATALTPGTGNPRRTLFALLQSVTALGTTDDLYSVYRRSCDSMGWEPKFDEAKRDNVSHEEGEHLTLSRRQTTRLRQLTNVDMAAYEFAKERAPIGD